MSYLQHAPVITQVPERIVPARVGRLYLLIQNRGPGVLYLGIGNPSLAEEGGGFELCKGASLELQRAAPDMAVYGASSSRSRVAVVEG